MLPLPEFDYHAPKSVREAIALLCVPGAMVVAGGTDLIPSIKHRLFAPSQLVSLRCITELQQITPLPDGGLAIGAGLRLRQVARDARVRADYPGLAAACLTIGTPTLQNMGTLGGNVLLDTRCLYYNQPAGWRASLGYCLKREGTVCHVAPKGKGCYAAHSADTIPHLWLLDAQIEVVGPRGVRLYPIRSLYSEDGRDYPIQREELLTRILLPPPAFITGHRKLRTRAVIDYGLLLVAASRDAAGYHAVISAVGPRPIAVHGEDPVALAEAAFRAVQPLSTHAPPVPWRKRMVRVEVRRAAEVL